MRRQRDYQAARSSLHVRNPFLIAVSTGFTGYVQGRLHSPRFPAGRRVNGRRELKLLVGDTQYTLTRGLRTLFVAKFSLTPGEPRRYSEIRYRRHIPCSHLPSGNRNALSTLFSPSFGPGLPYSTVNQTCKPTIPADLEACIPIRGAIGGLLEISNRT
ncbi:hypothetical protein NM688_g8116 [Phlebia brevispora]|uniref:Uncharacterized protein n=1 Tax=Phlebia brevispora TaxID=194682 RepID=A0ACC1RX38_9APHY|nr:hypothetical protein NM688_g8116 [Phlebia brevispora]